VRKYLARFLLKTKTWQGIPVDQLSQEFQATLSNIWPVLVDPFLIRGQPQAKTEDPPPRSVKAKKGLEV
jgi:hypothetical protein